MSKLRRNLGKAALILLILLLTVPFLIPVETSGTKSYKEAAPATGEFVELAGTEVFIERTPSKCLEPKTCQDAPLIILLHGFGASSYSFREIRAELSKFGEVISYDRPGFGYTERPTKWSGANPYGRSGNEIILSELIKRYSNGRKVILLGHSAGGTLAAQFALDYPGKIQGLILISPAIYANGGAPSWLNWLFYIPQLDRIGPLLVSSISSSGMELLKASWYDQSKLTPEIIEGYRAPLQIKGWERGFWEFSRSDRDYDVANRLEELTLPILILTGDSDTVVPTTDSEKLSGALSQSVLFVIPKTGHLAQEESPMETLKAIKVTWSILTR